MLSIVLIEESSGIRKFYRYMVDFTYTYAHSQYDSPKFVVVIMVIKFYEHLYHFMCDREIPKFQMFQFVCLVW